MAANEGKIIGIDLGTTNSVVALVEGSQPVVVPSAEGTNKTPSFVAFLENGDAFVGEKARRQAVTNPRRTISSVKRLLGRTFSDIVEDGDLFPYEIVNQDDNLLIDVGGVGYRPEQICALILKELRRSAEAYTGDTITQAVITVPAYFDDLQRQATKEAAAMAGLEVLRLINEPTAAAMAYGLGRSSGKDETIAVYDFGGGTFDVTVLEISGKVFEVLCSTGDSRLGGDDLDNAIVGRLVDEFRQTHGIDLSGDVSTLRRLKEVSEKAKCELSSAATAHISLPFLAYKDGQAINFERAIRREELEDLIEPFIQRTIRCCKRALEDAGLNKKDIAKVVLVGGSTRIPMVQEMVEDFFGIAPYKGVNPDEVVAVGAATQAGLFEGNIQEVTLLDVTPHSLGIEVKDGKFSKIIEKNSTIPIKAAKVFTTTEENQSFVNVHILQGESDEAAENRSLGKFTLSGIPPAPAGAPRIRVTFFINADGVMEFSATDLGSGAEKTLTVLHTQLSAEEKSNRRRKRAKNKPSRTERRANARRSADDAEAVGGGVPIRRSSSGVFPLPSIGGPPPPAPVIDQKRVIPANADPDKSGTSFAMLKESPEIRAMEAAPSIAPKSQVIRLESIPKGPVPLRPTGGPPSPPVLTVPPTTPPVAPAPLPPKPTFNPGAPPPPPPRTATPRPTPSIHSEQTQVASPEVVAAISEAVSRSQMPATPVKPFPPEVTQALSEAEMGNVGPEAEALYRNAMALLTSAPFDSDHSLATLEARCVLLTALGDATGTLKALEHLRDSHAAAHRERVGMTHERAFSRFEGSSDVRRARAAYREVAGDLAGAIDDLEQASRNETIDADVASLERLYRSQLTLATDPAVQFKLVKILLRSNRVDEAIEILQELQRHESYRQRAIKILGLCHWQKNLHYLAWQKFKLLEVNDEVKDMLYRLATDMEETDQLPSAVQVYEHLVAADPSFRDSAAKLKKLQYRLKLQSAERDTQKANDFLKDSRFVIVEEINRGSMGIIFKAKDKTLDEIVALKVLNDFLCEDPMAIERFKREARAAKKLSHPYIVRIHDMFESGNKRFISMEYIEGTDLKRMLSERTAFTEDMTVYYTIQICDALAYAHRLNIIHRDIKPANVMITKANVVKITDFGIAKILKSDEATRSGTAVIGTPLYMAPEQITGAGIDGRTDIYALGIMLYEMVSGNPPFYLGNIEYHHIHTPPPPLPERVSQPLAAVIMKCIEKEPAHRFQTVEELLEDIKRLRRA